MQLKTSPGMAVPDAFLKTLKTERQSHIQNGYNWPEITPEQVRTLYPNILFEMHASGWWIDTLAGHAMVSNEIMIAVLQDGEDLELNEFHGIAECFGLTGKFDFEYLAGHEIRVIDPSTEVGKEQTQHLGDILQRLPHPIPQKDWSFQKWFQHARETGGWAKPKDFERAKQVFEILSRGRLVAYADWRWAVKEMSREIRARSKAEPRRTTLRTIDAQMGGAAVRGC